MGSFDFVESVVGLPAGSELLDGAPSPSDVSFVFQVSLGLDSQRNLTSVQRAGCGRHGFRLDTGHRVRHARRFGGAARVFNDMELALRSPLQPGQTPDLFFEVSNIAVGTRGDLSCKYD
jgi:hypothetical protein